MGICGMPRALHCILPIRVKAVEQMIRANLPRFKICTLSWTLHDVHEPQSPEPVMTKSQSRTIPAMTSSLAGIVVTDF